MSFPIVLETSNLLKLADFVLNDTRHSNLFCVAGICCLSHPEIKPGDCHCVTMFPELATVQTEGMYNECLGIGRNEDDAMSLRCLFLSSRGH